MGYLYLSLISTDNIDGRTDGRTDTPPYYVVYVIVRRANGAMKLDVECSTSATGQPRQSVADSVSRRDAGHAVADRHPHGKRLQRLRQDPPHLHRS